MLTGAIRIMYHIYDQHMVQEEIIFLPYIARFQPVFICLPDTRIPPPPVPGFQWLSNQQLYSDSSIRTQQRSNPLYVSDIASVNTHNPNAYVDKKQSVMDEGAGINSTKHVSPIGKSLYSQPGRPHNSPSDSHNHIPVLSDSAGNENLDNKIWFHSIWKDLSFEKSFPNMTEIWDKQSAQDNNGH